MCEDTNHKASILILGGCGFIGRHLVEHFVTNDLVHEIRVVDKTPPVMAWLNAKHTELFKNPIVEFKSANLINPTSCKNAFTLPPSGKWDIVINCAAETKLGQTDKVYEEGIYKLSINCANEAANLNVGRYIELSSGNMNSSEKSPLKEDDSTEPWTLSAKYKLKVEKQLKKIPKLNFTILRLATVYGIGDRKGLTPRILIAALYRMMNETMKLFWNSSMKINTVHVTDVVNAIWYLANLPYAEKQTYNIVDDAESTQGSISNILAEIFNIKVDYLGLMTSNVAKIDMDFVISEINDKHMSPWADICQRDNVTNSPLTPYMEEELLYHKHLHIDNKKFKSTGYQLRVPQPTIDNINAIVIDFVEQGLFPKSMVI